MYKRQGWNNNYLQLEAEALEEYASVEDIAKMQDMARNFTDREIRRKTYQAMAVSYTHLHFIFFIPYLRYCSAGCFLRKNRTKPEFLR